jgi:hypothetical protein
MWSNGMSVLIAPTGLSGNGRLPASRVAADITRTPSP